MIRRIYGGFLRFVSSRWKRILLFGGIGIALIFILIQVFYPAGKLVPFTIVDNINMSGWSKKDAVTRLDASYRNTTLPVYFGTAEKPYKSPSPADIGITISNQKRIAAVAYPWYVRIVPTSIFWAHAVIHPSATPMYSRDTKVVASYIAKELGSSCSVQPTNATLKISGSKLVLVKSIDGGTCSISEVTTALLNVKPVLTAKNDIHIKMKTIVPSTSDADAEKLANEINTKVKNGVPVTAGSSTIIIPASQLLGWLDFSVVGDTFTFSFNGDRAASYVATQLAPKVTVAAGTSQVSTTDFNETARTNGANGQGVDTSKTFQSLTNYLLGTIDKPSVATVVVAPKVVYTRTYTPTDSGLSALIANFATSHPGTYGVSMYELDGKLRHAGYNDTQSFITASTYKLFIAYSSLLRIESGAWQWSDQIQGGNDLSTCFDKMIQHSDNACAEALLDKIGFVALTNEAHAIGCVNTSFLGKDGIRSTAADESLFLGMLQSGQVLSQQSSRDRLIADMKKNVYRQGIPAGSSGVVADKVGFLDALLHDAAIVYSPSGTYVLVIMTDNSTWANIAELTKEIEALRIL